MFKIPPGFRACSVENDPSNTAKINKRVSNFDDQDSTVAAGTLKTIEKRMDILNEASKSHAQKFIKKSNFLNNAPRLSQDTIREPTCSDTSTDDDLLSSSQKPKQTFAEILNSATKIQNLDHPLKISASQFTEKTNSLK